MCVGVGERGRYCCCVEAREHKLEGWRARESKRERVEEGYYGVNVGRGRQ